MKIKMILGVVVVGLAVSPLIAAHGSSNTERSYSKSYQSWGKKNQQSGHFHAMQKKPMTETGLLLQLDKKERQNFRNLPRHIRQEVLDILNQSGTRNYESVMIEVMERQNQQVERKQEKMLHNGMDRIQQ